MDSDGWNCEETRNKINASQDEQAKLQIEEINRAYKAAKISGRTPRHWLGKIKRLEQLKRPMPIGLEHLAGSTITINTKSFIESGKKVAKDYFATEYGEIRAKSLRATQKKYTAKNLEDKNQAKGGEKSGLTRRLNREKFSKEIIELFIKSKAVNPNKKPVARVVAQWYFENISPSKSKRAVTQLLLRSGLAT